MVGKAASIDPTRENLNSIHVTAAHTEATNGHILARVSLPKQFSCDDLPATIKTEDAEYIEPFIVPAKAAMQMKPFKVKNIACLDNSIFIDVEKTNINGVARFAMTNIDVTVTPELAKIDAVFPDCDRVIPMKKPDFQVDLNIAYLETLLAIAKSTGAEVITLRGNLPENDPTFVSNKPIILTAENDGQKFTGVIMPIKPKS